MASLDVEVVGRRVEALLDEVGTAEPAARRAAEELVRELLGLYGAGLERLLAVLGEAAPERLPSLAGDPLLGGLLALHDLHPVDLRTRVEAALDEVRGQAAADASVVEASDEVVRVSVDGGCDNCGASQARAAVEDAVRAAVPDVERVEVTQARRVPNGLISPDRLRARPAGWAMS